MDYTLLTKDVGISEGNGVWIVSLEKNKTQKKQTLRVLDFYGQLHNIDVTVEAATKSENAVKSPRSTTKTVTQEDKKKPSTTDSSGKPISLEKFISK